MRVARPRPARHAVEVSHDHQQRLRGPLRASRLGGAVLRRGAGVERPGQPPAGRRGLRADARHRPGRGLRRGRRRDLAGPAGLDGDRRRLLGQRAGPRGPARRRRGRRRPHVTGGRSTRGSFAAEGRTFDLVTTHFLHPPDGGMVDVTRRLADAVAPGGHLLVVGHAPSSDMPHLSEAHRRAMFLAADLVPGLPGGFEPVVVEQRPRDRHPRRPDDRHRRLDLPGASDRLAAPGGW